MKYRHEYKHEISLADAIVLRQRLKAVICEGLQQTQKGTVALSADQKAKEKTDIFKLIFA